MEDCPFKNSFWLILLHFTNLNRHSLLTDNILKKIPQEVLTLVKL